MSAVLAPGLPASPVVPAVVPPTPPTPLTYGRDPTAYRWTVQQYERMIQFGILGPRDKVELLEGHVVLKMSKDPAHDGTIDVVTDALRSRLPAGWRVRVQQTLSLPDSQPEPDVAVVRGDARTYLTRHPTPADAGLVMEVANTSLLRDQRDKRRAYAAAGVGVYWIANLTDQCVEVYTQPSGPADSPGYAQTQVYRPGDLVPLTLDGTPVGPIPAADLLP